MKKILLVLFLINSLAADAATYYLAPKGSDASGNGSITSPWFTLNKAWAVAKAGDIIYLRGGEYIYTTQQTLSNKSGSSGNLIKIWAYPGEIPVLKHTTSSGWFILMESSNYVHFKGIEVSGENHIGSGLNWEMYNCNNNILENLNYHHMIQGLFIRGQSNGNLVLNCDFHHNQDPNSSPPYEHADGFGFNWSDAAGLTNTVRGCRFYWNCDDGMDMWSNDNNIIIDNCWSFYNGYKPDTFTAVGTGGAGFKFGISDVDHGSTVLITVKNCISYKNKGWGYNQNGCQAKIAFYNNIAYLNVGMAFWLNDYATKDHILTNNIAYSNGSVGSISSASVLTTNTFLQNGTNNSSYSVSNSDFLSCTGDELLTARKADGSLPDINFLHLVSSSDLIDKGTDVGIAYSGTKPDLGPFEYNLTQQTVAPVYNSSVVSNATPSIIEMAYDLSLANIVPAVSAFSVQVNSVARTINSVAIVGGKVQLTLSSAVVYGNTVTVSYTAPVTNPLQTSSGGIAASISTKPVTNNCTPPIPLYLNSVIENATPSIILMTYNLSLANVVPSVAAFSVKVNSATRTVNSVSIVGGKVQLTLSSAVAYGDLVSVAYTVPASNPLQTASGGLAAGLSAISVTNNCTTTVPSYISSVIENDTPTILQMTYDLSLANIVPSVSAFKVMVNSVARAINSVAIVSDTVELTLASAVVYGDIVNVSYTSPASNQLQTTSGQFAASISAKSVTNECIATAPVYVSSVIENTTPTLLEITFSLSLANIVPSISAFSVQVNSVTRSVNSVAIVGGKLQLTLASAVVYNDVVTVSYTAPSSNPLQTVSGGLATSMSSSPVTNNCISVVPVYVSSVIENAAPSILVMTYNINLANISPAVSAFSVKVNSVTRTINTVAIGSGKVQLTLASPVIFGDIVTVAYTVPASNQLQTTSGGEAESIGAKSVTNNCVAIVPVYVSSVIENATPNILEMTYSLSLANIVPPISAFRVRVNSVTRTINSVAIPGGKVRLTLASAVVYGDIVTVSYTKSANNPLQTVSGGVAASISSNSVTNNCLSPTPLYTGSVVENATPAILEMTYNLSLANIVPAAAAFDVQVNSITRTINSVAIVSGKVQLTLASAVVYDDIVTVSYTAPASNPLQTSSGGLAASIASVPVTNNCISIVPVYVSSVIENATPTILEMTYNLSLTSIVPSRTSFSVRVNSVTRRVNSVAIVDGKVQLTLSSAVVYGDVVTVSYTKATTNPLQTASGGIAESISAKSVTNNCISAVPVYVNSVIEDNTPSTLEMSYNLSLANIVPAVTAFNVQVNSQPRSVSSVAISSGKVQLTLSTAVVAGDIVTVSYSVPSSNPLQTVSHGLAASISDKPVTNNSILTVPLYVNSVIENATPSTLYITYDLNLARITPPVSAFDVQVNSVTRVVSSVSIVNGMVRLRLASPVFYNDSVTVSYTVPAINPLQTISGGLATSISEIPVTNNCISILPVYVSSVIENATPSKLKMMYTLSLANITPPVSAFNVQVNSVTMAVISDSIVDGNVRLTMAGAVAYNDIVTISYTAPQENALQTDLGDLATSITNQPVNNYVDAIVSNYINSVVENATPTVIEVSFDSQLADFLPATTSFSVQINNETVQVNSVNIVDGKVQLTLASAVVYGDMVTVSYTRPKTNALQSVSGGVVENLNAQPVTNNCLDVSTKNTPPVVMIKNDAESYSGFVYQIDATGSYDINNDILTFDWILPDSVSASSTNDSKILFLAPMVGASHYFEFMLNVNDGKSIVSKIIPINILPYKPDLYAARITKVEASDFQVPDYPTNAADGTSTTKWSVNGDNQWLTFTLARSFNISYLEIAFLPGQRYESYFDIYASKDNLNWDPILLNASSCNFSGDIQIFDFPTEDINTEYSYVKLIGHGNSLNKLNSYSEIKIIGYIPQNSRSNSSDSRKITIYPNPAQSFFNISLEEPDIEPDTFRIIDSSGRIVFEDSFSKGIKNVQIPNDLSSGIYLIEIGSGTTILDVQKLIINR